MAEHTWLEYAAPYALNALDAAERAEFEAHLAECGACRAELRTLQETAGLLGYSAPPAMPPPSLKERVLRAARASARASARQNWFTRQAGARVGWLAAAAVAAIALLAGYAYFSALNETLLLQESYDEQSAELRAKTGLLAEREAVIESLLAPELSTAALASSGRPPAARLFWNRTRNVVVVAAFDLPPAPAGRTYQLWGLRGGAPISLGTFNTSRAGRATLALAVPAGLELDLSAVTEEPAGGSPQPTSAPFLVGPWQSTD